MRSAIFCYVGLLLLCSSLFSEASIAQPKLNPKGKIGSEPAQQTAIIETTTPEVTVRVLKDAGYDDAKIYTAKNGTQHASGKVFDVLVSVIHYYDDDKQARNVGYLAIFAKQDDVDARFASAYNSTYRWAKAYLDEEGRFVLTMDYALGVPRGAFVDASKRFSTMVKLLLEFSPGK